MVFVTLQINNNNNLNQPAHQPTLLDIWAQCVEYFIDQEKLSGGSGAIYWPATDILVLRPYADM